MSESAKKASAAGPAASAAPASRTSLSITSSTTIPPLPPPIIEPSEAPKPSKMKFAPNLAGAQRSRGQKSENPLTALTLSRAGTSTSSVTVASVVPGGNPSSSATVSRGGGVAGADKSSERVVPAKVAFQAHGPTPSRGGGQIKTERAVKSESSGRSSKAGTLEAKTLAALSDMDDSPASIAIKHSDEPSYSPLVLDGVASVAPTVSNPVTNSDEICMLPANIVEQLPAQCEARQLFSFPPATISRSACVVAPSPLLLVQLPAHLPSQAHTRPSWDMSAPPVSSSIASSSSAFTAPNDLESLPVEDSGDMVVDPSSSSSSSSSSASSQAVSDAASRAAAAAAAPYMDRLAAELYQFEHAANVTRLPSGYLGELVVMRSGKVKLRLGDVLMDVTSGTNATVHQEIVRISQDEAPTVPTEGASISGIVVHARRHSTEDGGFTSS